jgi:hypothetical protein
MEQSKPDRPTDEMLGKGVFSEEPVSLALGAKTRMRRLDSSEIDRLYLKGALTQDQHHTLECFQSDLYDAGMIFCPKAGLIQSGTSGHAQYIADTAFRRVKRVDHQMELLGQVMNGQARMVVLSALSDDRRVSKSQEILMSGAAEVLAQVYDPRCQSSSRGSKP